MQKLMKKVFMLNFLKNLFKGISKNLKIKIATCI